MAKLPSKRNRQWVCVICHIKCLDAVILSSPKRLKFRIWWLILFRFWHRLPWYQKHKSLFITSKATKLSQIAFKSISTMICKITYVFTRQTNSKCGFNCNVESKLQVTVELSTPEATPGQEVDITVISKPNSYIGLMGIDQSVLLLREGNDLDQTEVFSELEVYSKRGQSYGKWNSKTSLDFSVRCVNRSFGCSPIYKNDKTHFQNAGTVLISNARTPEISKCFVL